MEKVYHKKDKIIIEIPYWSDRWNPWMEKIVGKHKTLIGMITYDNYGNEEMGFANVIDMDYKGKPDQETSIQYYFWNWEEKEFRESCKKLGLGFVDARNIEYVKEDCRKWVKEKESL